MNRSALFFAFAALFAGPLSASAGPDEIAAYEQKLLNQQDWPQVDQDRCAKWTSGDQVEFNRCKVTRLLIADILFNNDPNNKGNQKTIQGIPLSFNASYLLKTEGVVYYQKFREVRS